MALLFFAGAFGIQRRQAGKQGFFGFGQRIGFVHQGVSAPGWPAGRQPGLASQASSTAASSSLCNSFSTAARPWASGVFLGVQQGCGGVVFPALYRPVRVTSG